jgi:hypothetical protein
MNFADKAEQLRTERLEKERQEQAREAQEKKEAAEKKRREADIKMEKAKELASLFKQFHGRKICGGHVTLECNWAEAYNDSAVILKTGSVGSSVFDQYKPNTPLFSAHYEPASESYHLERYLMPPNPPTAFRRVGQFKTTNELMNALAEEVSKL